MTYEQLSQKALDKALDIFDIYEYAKKFTQRECVIAAISTALDVFSEGIGFIRPESAQKEQEPVARMPSVDEEIKAALQGYKAFSQANQRKKEQKIEQPTLRDQFAMAAFQLLASRTWGHLKISDAELMDVWVNSAFTIADKAIIARKTETV